jgi:hypothetical protein
MSYQQYQLDALHRQDLSRHAAKFRLVAMNTAHAPKFGMIGLRLGRWLEAIGTRLQERYQDLNPVPVTPRDVKLA